LGSGETCVESCPFLGRVGVFSRDDFCGILFLLKMKYLLP
jgi:hypothetical protein